MSTSEPSLLPLLHSALAANTAPAWETFFEHARPFLYRSLRLRRSSEIESRLDDLVQLACLRLCRNDYLALRRFAGATEAQLLAYLRTVAHHVSLDMIRKHEPLEPILHDAFSSTAPPQDRAILLSQVRRLVTSCASANRSRDEEVFWLYYASGLTATAIASIPRFDLTTKGVESLIFRLIRCVRASIAKQISKGISRTASSQQGEHS